MTLNRREFMLKTAAISGMGIMSASIPLLASVKSAVAESADIPKPVLLQDARKMATRLGIDPRIWNWHKDDGSSAVMPANYYEASLSEWPELGKLSADQTCDVVIIGGGLLGASTALHLAEAGLDVIVIEKDNVGSGASGRNGGQATPGLARWDAATMLSNLSADEASRLWQFCGAEALDIIDELSVRHDFACERKRGHITAAVHAGHMGFLVESADARKRLGDSAVRIVGVHELKEYIRSDIYHGAAVDSAGGQVHPLALLRGLVYSFIRKGGRVYEKTAVQGLEKTPAGAVVATQYGTIRARKAVVLAVHSYTSRLLSDHSTTMPFFTYVAVTPPLPMDIRELLPADMPVYDTQLQIDYYRAVRDNRLLFGGQGTGNSWSPRDVNNYLLERIRTVFPQLPDPQLEYSWSGISDITVNGITDCRKSDDAVPVYAVHGWNGHGVAQTVRIGKAISDDMTGRNDDFLMLTRFDHKQIPLNNYIGPVAIPLVKGALGLKSMLNPADIVSF